ncbi:MAG: hypothetical protein K8M05_30470 [Deltaproteobacteria bacterium]|nr:hypothetical protein [Kofleriaceae bacterium]
MSARSLWVAACAAAVLVLSACPAGGPKIPGRGGSGVDPNTCGNYAASDAGRKLKAFLEATVRVDEESQRMVNVIGESCAIMGRELAMAGPDLEGQPKDVCARVFERLNADLKVAIKADAKLNVVYKPAVCTLDMQASARAAAQCEAKAEADVQMTCNGTCNGTCDGTCKGSAGTGGSGGDCNGVCEGTCRGSCEGTAEVDASAECRAQAEVNASVDMQCTEPEFSVEVEASAIVDATKAEAAMNAMRKGFPKIFSVQARLKPFQAAVSTWASTATSLAAAGRDLANSFKDQALCITGQIKAAADAVARVNVNVEVSVEVSASASASAGTR